MRRWVPLLILLNAASLDADNWSQFRGSNSSGIAQGAQPPERFGPGTNLLWKVGVPPGHSSPIVWHDRLFLSAYSNSELQTLCLDRKNGGIVWSKTLSMAPVQSSHRANNPASSTPATDGETVCVYFPAFGLIGYNFDGRERWRKPLPVPVNPYGAAASPAILDGRIILNCEDDSTNACLLAVNPKDGQTIWRVDRRGGTSTYSTPVSWVHDGRTELLHASSLRLIAFDPMDGREKWYAGGLEWMSQVATPVIGDGLIFVMSRSNADDKDPDFKTALAQYDKDHDGRLAKSELPSDFHRWWFKMDRNEDGFLSADEWDHSYQLQVKSDYGLLAFRPGVSGDVTTTHLAWKHKKGIPQVPSPLYYRGRVYMVNDGGRVSCFEAKTGRVLYQQERLGAEGEYYASPVAANGKVFFSSNRGVVTVVDAADELRVLERNDLSEELMATPAIVDNQVYVRTVGTLWAFGR